MRASPKAPRHPVARERLVQASIVEAHRLCVVNPWEALLFAVPNGEVRDPVTARMLTGYTSRAREIMERTLPEGELLRPYGQGVLAGVVDLVLVLASRVIFVEVKRGADRDAGSRAGTMSASQRRFQKAVTALGHEHWVLDSADAYLALLRGAGVALRVGAQLPSVKAPAALADVLRRPRRAKDAPRPPKGAGGTPPA